MTVALVANVARPISSAISTAFSADSYGALSSYGLLGSSANPDAVIEALFANSEVGAWYDPSDLSTMFQDSAGTTPVTADGQPVGLILDKSGRNNHASQATAAKRPLYKTSGGLHWLQFDGVDDALSTAAIDFTATDKMSVFSGSNGEKGICASNPTGSGFAVIRVAANGGYRGDLKNTATPSATLATNVDKVITSLFDSAEVTVLGQSKARFNGVSATLTEIGSLAVGNQGTYSIQVGDWASAFKFLGRIYSLIVLGRLATTQEITDTEAWVNSKTGAY